MKSGRAWWVTWSVGLVLGVIFTLSKIQGQQTMEANLWKATRLVRWTRYLDTPAENWTRAKDWCNAQGDTLPVLLTASALHAYQRAMDYWKENELMRLVHTKNGVTKRDIGTWMGLSPSITPPGQWLAGCGHVSNLGPYWTINNESDEPCARWTTNNNKLYSKCTAWKFIVCERTTDFCDQRAHRYITFAKSILNNWTSVDVKECPYTDRECLKNVTASNQGLYHVYLGAESTLEDNQTLETWLVKEGFTVLSRQCYSASEKVSTEHESLANCTSTAPRDFSLSNVQHPTSADGITLKCEPGTQFDAGTNTCIPSSLINCICLIRSENHTMTPSASTKQSGTSTMTPFGNTTSTEQSGTSTMTPSGNTTSTEQSGTSTMTPSGKTGSTEQSGTTTMTPSGNTGSTTQTGNPTTTQQSGNGDVEPPKTRPQVSERPSVGKMNYDKPCCRCQHRPPPEPATQQAASAKKALKAQLSQKIQKELKVEQTGLAKQVARKRSSEDPRESSSRVGMVLTIPCLVLPVLVIVMSDVLTLVRWLVRRFGRRGNAEIGPAALAGDAQLTKP